MIDPLFNEVLLLVDQLRPANLSGNSIFIGFIGAALAGSAGWYGRILIKAVYFWIRRKLFDEIVLYSDDEVLQYIETYISRTRDLTKRRNVIAVLRGANDSDDDGYRLVNTTSFLGANKDTNEPLSVKYILGEGNHFLLLRSSFCWMNKSIETDKVGNKRTIVKLRIFGNSGKKTLEECVSEQVSKENGENVLKISAWSVHGGFNMPVIVPKRNLSSLILPGTVISDIYKDLESFSRKKKWYQERGIPYKRGYLLYGPPGTGKTSLIKAIVSSFTNRIYTLNLSVVDNDSTLDQFFYEVSYRSAKGLSFIVMEDIDCVLASKNREGDGKVSEKGVTLNGLLNALDGLSSADNLVVFMTTNYVDKLDPALIRPGRADVKYLIDKLDTDSIIKYLQLFFQSRAYTEELPVGIKVSGAELQEICMKAITISQAIEELKKLS